MQVASEIGGDIGRQTIMAAQQSFLDGMTVSLGVIAALVAFGAVVVWTRLPGHERELESVETPVVTMATVGAELSAD